MITRTINGHEITLESGKRYIASRPMAERGRKSYPITIKTWDTNKPAATLPAMSYDDANDFLSVFNNEGISFNGRVW